MDRQKIERAGTFILGGVAGAVFGVLISPRSGREVRGSMSSRAGEARDRGRESYFEARERARERLAAIRESNTPRDTGEMIVGEPAPEEVPAADPGPTQPERRPGLRAVPSEESEESEESAESEAGEGDYKTREDQDASVDSETSEALRRRISKTRERLRGGGTDG
jgi:hypothetical protein